MQVTLLYLDGADNVLHERWQPYTAWLEAATHCMDGGMSLALSTRFRFVLPFIWAFLTINMSSPSCSAVCHVDQHAPLLQTSGSKPGPGPWVCLGMGATVLLALHVVVNHPHSVASGLYLTADSMAAPQPTHVRVPKVLGTDAASLRAPQNPQHSARMRARRGQVGEGATASSEGPLDWTRESRTGPFAAVLNWGQALGLGAAVLASAVLLLLRRAPGPRPASEQLAMVSVVGERATDTTTIREQEVLGKLSRIIDPDLGQDIVACGFVKNLRVDPEAGTAAFVLELTTPACPVKGEFERAAREYVAELPWVKEVNVVMDAQVPEAPTGQEFPGLSRVANIIAVSSCKGGVGKSTTAVNLAYALAQMGARVGLFDADIYGPSLPTMISPEFPLHEMDPETKAITPVDYEGVKCVSFGFAGQGSAIMRGPMVSGLVQQLLTTTNWGELEYLIIDMPPGTGDIQLTLGQIVPITAAVIVTTPQNLAFVDVAKGIRMFSRLRVPCISVVENMAYFEVNGERVHPFGTGSGDRVVADFGVPHLFRVPINPSLSKAGDTGKPFVLEELGSPESLTYSDLGVALVQVCRPDAVPPAIARRLSGAGLPAGQPALSPQTWTAL